MDKAKLSKAIGDLPGVGPDKNWTNELERGRRPGPRMQQQVVLPDSFNDSTKCVHSGTYIDENVGAVGTPIFQSSTFLFSSHTYESFFQGVSRDTPIYTRYGNPSQWAVQEKIAALEGAESCVVFASGMAAISTALIALTNRGGSIISSQDVYGGTYNLLHHDMHQLGREVVFVDPTDIEQIKSAIKDNTQVIFLETLSNPLVKSIPLQEIVKLSKANNILFLVDNTFLTPYSSKPILHGVDLVIHSCTKYMNGHSDLTAGCVSGSRKYVDRVWEQMLRFGGHLDPLSCFLLERGLKTLAVRMRAHTENATVLASYLANHPKVKHVFHPNHDEVSQKYIHDYASNGFTGLFSFEVGSNEKALELMDALHLAVPATSLGGVETLISMPFNTSHSTLTEDQRKQIGINPGLIRISVGIEHIDDLLSDFEAALSKI